jgi:hypothetical protein
MGPLLLFAMLQTFAFDDHIISLALWSRIAHQYA